MPFGAYIGHLTRNTKYHLVSLLFGPLGKRVRALRLERQWTQVEMAEMLGVDRSYLSEIETGKKDPSMRVLKPIADGLGMSLSRLLSGF